MTKLRQYFTGGVLGLLLGLAFLGTAATVSYFGAGSADQLGVSLATLIAGEDQTNNVLRTEQQFSYSGDRTADGSAIKASPGFVHTVVCQGTDGTATAGTIALLDSTAAGAGTKVWEWDVQAVALTSPITVTFDTVMGTGIFLDFTTTADVSCSVTYR